MKLILALLLTALTGSVHAASCQDLWDGSATAADLDENLACLSWAIPTQNTDGSPLDIEDISAYKIYYGTDAANLDQLARVDVNTATGYELVFGCEVAIWHFEITAEKTVDIPAQGSQAASVVVNESARSDQVSKQFICVPESNAPTEFRVQFRITT